MKTLRGVVTLVLAVVAIAAHAQEDQYLLFDSTDLPPGHLSVALAPGGAVLYFASSNRLRPKAPTTIYRSDLNDGTWASPQLAGSVHEGGLSGIHFSADGAALYAISVESFTRKGVPIGSPVDFEAVQDEVFIDAPRDASPTSERYANCFWLMDSLLVFATEEGATLNSYYRFGHGPKQAFGANSTAYDLRIMGTFEKDGQRWLYGVSDMPGGFGAGDLYFLPVSVKDEASGRLKFGSKRLLLDPPVNAGPRYNDGRHILDVSIDPVTLRMVWISATDLDAMDGTRSIDADHQLHYADLDEDWIFGE